MSVFKLIEKRFGFASGTLFFVFCTVFVKGVGFLYKIPLFNALGAFGAGLYQSVFSVFTLCINLAGAGIPSAMTKLIASGENAKAVLLKTLKIFSALGFVFFALLFIFSGLISKIQGNVLAKSLYLVISPSVFIVGVISCFRGYFQGLGQFKPTAISQVIEQVVKSLVGVILFTFSSGNYVQKSILACFSVTLSELVALSYLIFKYRYREMPKYAHLSNNKTVSSKTLLKLVLPITAVTLMLPLGAFFDGLTVVNILSRYAKNSATALYGIYAGGIETLIALPVSLLHVLAVGFLPKMSKDSGNSGKKLLFYTAVLSLIFFIAFQIFPKIIVKILFGGFLNYQSLIIKLIRISAVNVIFLSMLSASNTVLLSMDKQFYSLFSMPVGLAVKITLNLLLLKLPSINIFALVFSDLAFYAVSLLLNLIEIAGQKITLAKFSGKAIKHA